MLKPTHPIKFTVPEHFPEDDTDRLSNSLYYWLLDHATSDWRSKSYDLRSMTYRMMDEQVGFDKVNNEGKFAKRLGKYLAKANKEHELGIDKETRNKLVEQLANAYQDIYVPEFTGYIDISDTANWKAGQFGDHHACFFADRSDAKDAIMEKGYAARIWRIAQDENDYIYGGRKYNPDEYVDDHLEGIARCWLVGRGDWYTVFNAYCMDGHKPYIDTQIFANALMQVFPEYVNVGKARIVNWGEGSGHVYVNSERGHIITQGSTVASEYDIEVGEEIGTPCDCCGDRIHNDNLHYAPNGEPLCESCFCDNVGYCEECNEEYYRDDMVEVPEPRHRWYTHVCRDCADEHYPLCEHCDTRHTQEDTLTDPDDNNICESCYDDKVRYCERCNVDVWTKHMAQHGEAYYVNEHDMCSECAEDHTTTCPHCDNTVINEDFEEADNVCRTCFEELQPELMPA